MSGIVSELGRLCDYDLSGCTVGYRPLAIGDDGSLQVEFSFTSQFDCPSPVNFGLCVRETAVVPIYPDLGQSVYEFNEAVGGLEMFDFPVKEKADRCANPKPAAEKCGERPAKPKSAPKTGNASKAKPSGAPAAGEVARWIVGNSAWNVPASRFAVEFRSEDRKHGNYVYEVRFYPKSVKRLSAAERTKYASGVLNVRISGDTPEKVAARFDRILKTVGKEWLSGYSRKGK